MMIDPGFDPIFNTAPARRDNDTGAERSQFLFDGWSYQPLSEPRDRTKADAERQD